MKKIFPKPPLQQNDIQYYTMQYVIYVFQTRCFSSSLSKPNMSAHDELFKGFFFMIKLCFSVIASKGKAFTEPCLGLGSL